MPSKLLPNLYIYLIGLLISCHTQAREFDLVPDSELDQLMIEWSSRPDSGVAPLEERIAQITQSDGAYSPKLYSYLGELSRIKQINNQHLEAIDLFQRMQVLTHSADGVHSALQLDAIKLQSRSLRALGQFVKADRLESFHLWVAEQNFSGADLVPSLWRMADWQRTTMQYSKALKNYQRVLAIIDSHDLANVYEVRTLEAQALTEYLSRTCCAHKSLALSVESRLQSQFSDQADNQAALLNLADMKVLKNQKAAYDIYAELGNVPVAMLGPKDQSTYIRALDASTNPAYNLGQVEVFYPKQAEAVTFGPKKPQPSSASIGEPVRLCAANIQANGFVDVAMQVSPRGIPYNLEISGKVSHATKRYLRAVLLDSRYRPEFRNGEPVAQTLKFRQYFDRTRPMQTDQVAGWRDILAEHACQYIAMR